jgi:hypothetical protein
MKEYLVLQHLLQPILLDLSQVVLLDEDDLALRSLDLLGDEAAQKSAPFEHLGDCETLGVEYFGTMAFSMLSIEVE